MVCVFVANADASITREYASLLTRKPGSVMNQKILDEYRMAIESVALAYKNRFRKIEIIDTSEDTQLGITRRTTELILKALEELIVEKIGFFARKEINTLKAKRVFSFSDIENKSIEIRFENRLPVEANENAVQPIPIIVFTDERREKLFVVKKRIKSVGEGSPEKGRLLAYVGGHTRDEDALDLEPTDFLKICGRALAREIQEELGISYYPSGSDPLCIWLVDNPKSAKHLAVCFIACVDFKQFRFHLSDVEFVQKVGGERNGLVMERSEIESNINRFEPWSRAIIEKVFGIRPESGVSELEFVFDER